MAAARRPARAPIFLLREQVDVDVDGFAAEPGLEWRKIKCASKRAYGCGEHAKKALEGLTLYVRPGDESLLNYTLAIRMTDEARRGFESELNLIHRLKDTRVCHHFICPRKDTPCYQTIATGIVQIADYQGLIVIFLLFRRDFGAELAYYLVYDLCTASLCLIQQAPDVVEAVCSIKPVAKRNASNDFELFVMACQLSSVPRHFLCACTPETRANAASDGTGPWQVMKQPFQLEEIDESFSAHLVFSFKSMGIWADLSRGLMYCDLDSSDDVDFGFIQLPQECLLDMMQEEMAEKVTSQPMEVTRTMGCVRNSISFVCIDPAEEYANDLVKMWTLNLPHGRMKDAQWKKVREARVSELWRFDRFKEAGLPEGPLEYPVLTADGGLCVVVSDQSKFPGPYQGVQLDDICIFDMRLKRLRWHGLAHDYRFINSVVSASIYPQFPPKEARQAPS
ncbi:hypothetical protein HU200_008592 [Digitaria exilis]|uniref:DUF1618 domain-containing protein n=1 Tax=Digitaria exilis TaxID=1010633 RepID=A0A835FLC8_9POAL|nr:hypothetical protein HU200_008592 [Digitaria exilis]CAB3447458.1 unnamed protein product [Digitaria exilis]